MLGSPSLTATKQSRLWQSLCARSGREGNTGNPLFGKEMSIKDIRNNYSKTMYKHILIVEAVYESHGKI